MLHLLYNHIVSKVMTSTMIACLILSAPSYSQSEREYNFSDINDMEPAASSTIPGNTTLLLGVGALSALAAGVVGAVLTSSNNHHHRSHRGPPGSTGPNGDPLHLHRGPASLIFEILSDFVTGTDLTYQVYITLPDQSVIVSPVLDGTASYEIVIPAPALAGPYTVTFQVVTSTSPAEVQGTVGVINTEDDSVTFLNFQLPISEITGTGAGIYVYIPEESFETSSSSSGR